MEKNLIKAILACDDEGGIGRYGTLPWPRNKTDLQWFKCNTEGHIVVMGSSTWKDPHMPTPLPNRVNLVVTSKPDDPSFKGAYMRITGDPIPVLKELAKGSQDVWVIGGASIINQTMDVIEEFYLSRISGAYACDVFLDLDRIKETYNRDVVVQHGNVRFEIWRK